MVNIEIDGIPLKVDASKMIIQAADEAGIDIPRFCYHKKLSIAANCRMCLVEVDKARKAMPACATPVVEGMRVFTQSKMAVNAQRSVMEFLLINHPLDCPICDQGGECELQDLSMGYGDGVSRFTEGKRVVKDKDIGPLIQTEMTRCIHCTRCVRFGTEIAGVKELGATGRGEHMEIGTYVEHSLVSELSGNIIDLCPVGALTSKPFRYSARAWEMKAYPSIAPHDAIGSNIELHVRKEDVMRVVPRENEALNESWLSDRDRFSYLGLNHPQRLVQPMLKLGGEWQTTDWQTALEATVDGLKSIIERYGVSEVAGLISPTSTLEEAYLLQKWLRGLRIEKIDHRLRQQDVTQSQQKTRYSTLSLGEVDAADSIVMLGTNIRNEMPILAHRIRQAAQDGALVSSLNCFQSDLLMPLEHDWVMNAPELLDTLAGVAKILSCARHAALDERWSDILPERAATATEQNLAMQLANAMNGMLMVGEMINHHPQAGLFQQLLQLIADLSNNHLVYLPVANEKAHHIAQTQPSDDVEHVSQYWQQCLRAYLLLGVEPELDTAQPQFAKHALEKASFVVAVNSFDSPAIRAYADVILPMACFAETSGTFVGLDGTWQSFAGAVPARGESRPAWKILRVLGNISELNGFDYVSSQEVKEEIQQGFNLQASPSITKQEVPAELNIESSLMLISEVPSYRSDALVRHSEALQKTAAVQLAQCARINASEAEKRGLKNGDMIAITQALYRCEVPLVVDDGIADGCIYLAAATEAMARLGMMYGQVDVEVVP